MTRKIRLALGLKLAALLLAIGLIPVRAWAESPTEFYENLAETVGVSVDLASEAWQDKTINAYLEYINQNISGGTPYSFYQYGVQLEALTGYDVAYVEDGKYYINSAPGEGSGGAFYGVECNQWNLSSLALETSKWLKYAAENGPDWPNGTGGGSGSGGSSEPSDGYYIFNMTVPYFYGPGVPAFYVNNSNYFVSYNSNSSVMVPKDGVIVRVKQSIIDALTVEGNIYVTLTGNVSYSNGGTVRVYKGVMSVTQYWNTGYPTVYNSCDIEWPKTFTVDGKSASGNATNDGWVYTLDSASIGNAGTVQAFTSLMSQPGGNGGGGNEPSDEPPIETPQAPNIVFPGITLPDFPDFNTTNNYTPGEIDFTPIIERLDDIDADLELFYDSFNEFRTDFVTYMDGVGDALNTINQSIWSCEQKINDVITWLKNIFSRLGGTGGSKPDPSTNQDGFWEWLREMLEKLFGALPTETDDMLTQFQRLTTRFPFSVPWDVYALLAMFVSQPVTPVIDMPFPMPEVIYPNGYFMAHIDLTPYDGVAAMVRKLELVAFVGWLTWRTFDMIRGGEDVVG